MKNVNRLALILAALLCAGLLSACGGKKDETVDVKTYSYDAGEFITNIKNSNKMLSCAIKMDLISESLLTTLTEKDYVAKDVINRRLRELTEADLEADSVQETLSKALVADLNAALNTEGFFKVYFVRFVYQ